MPSENNKLVLLSGASGGIGAACAQVLAARGYRLGLCYKRNKQDAEALANSINGKKNRAMAVEMNYASRESIQAAMAKVCEHFQAPISILINNGAKAQEKPFDSISDDDWQTMMAVNLQGPFMASQEVIPSMLEHKWGRIINVSSIGGQWGGFNQVHYAAAKAGLINLTRSLAKIYSKNNISTIAVAIGLAATKMTEKELSSLAGQEKLKNVPARRLATCEEIAATIAFLCSDEAAYLSGQTINLNGGMYFG